MKVLTQAPVLYSEENTFGSQLISITGYFDCCLLSKLELLLVHEPGPENFEFVAPLVLQSLVCLK